jgi:Protein of unknown function (DUF2628)
MASLLRSAKMRIWTVHLKPTDKNPYANALFISEGFNIFAFLFTGFWALANRIWWLAGCIFLAQYGTLYLAKLAGFSSTSIVMIDIAIRVILGLCGNDFWRMSLSKAGWVMSDIIVANNMLDAAHRYYGRYIGEIEHHLQHPPARKSFFREFAP